MFEYEEVGDPVFLPRVQVWRTQVSVVSLEDQILCLRSRGRMSRGRCPMSMFHLLASLAKDGREAKPVLPTGQLGRAFQLCSLSKGHD